MHASLILNAALFAAPPEQTPPDPFESELDQIEVVSGEDDAQIIAYDSDGEVIGSITVWVEPGGGIHLASDYADGYAETVVTDDRARTTATLPPRGHRHACTTDAGQDRLRPRHSGEREMALRGRADRGHLFMCHALMGVPFCGLWGGVRVPPVGNGGVPMRRPQVDSASPSAGWGWIPALLTVLMAGDAGYQLASDEKWSGMVLVVGIALAGLADWYTVRRRSADAQFAADSMLTVFMVAMLVIGLLVRT